MVEPPAPLLCAEVAAAATEGPLASVSAVAAALARLGPAPLHHLQLLDACHAQDIEPTVPALVLGVDGREAALALRKTLLRLYPPQHRVQVLPEGGASAAAPAARPREMALSRLARAGLFDASVSLYLPPLPVEAAFSSLRGLRQIVARLRADCPWDREQTLASLVPYSIEEAYEVVEAITDGDMAGLCEELGDLWLQVLIQTQVASETGAFDLVDVMQELGAKLVRRHPHVFGQARADSAADVVRRWEDLKAQERERPESVLTGVLKSQPALRATQELQKRASRAGFDWPTREGVETKLREELRELLEAGSREAVSAELGDVLSMLAKLGLSWQIDAELALRQANARFTSRFQYLERKLREQGHAMNETPLDELLALWQQAKQAEGESRRLP